ncbi:unnamed protein product, partial [Meganyctiphanes norvegica]
MNTIRGAELFLLVLLTLAGASAQVSKWGLLDEGLIMDMYELFGDPLEQALEDVPIIMEYTDPASDASSPLAEGTSHATKENKALRYYLPSVNSSISNECRHDVEEVLKAFALAAMLPSKARLWSVQMVDSWGKLPDGYLYMNAILPGMMEECMGITVDDQDSILFPPMEFNATFKGKYCFVIHGPVSNIPSIGSPVTSGNIPNIMDFGSWYGTCMPDSCSREDFKVSLEEILPDGHVARSIDCHTKDEELQWEPKDYAFVGVIGFISFLVIAAAVVDLVINHMEAPDLRKGPLRYLLVFSGYTNMSKIFHINTKNSQSNIACLHGIRVLTMTWVIWGHQTSFSISFVFNQFNGVQMYQDVIAQTILGASVSVDTFFFLSGLLVAYGLMRAKDKMDLYGFFMLYVHRILRLMPPIAAVCFFSATVARFFSRGPLGEYMNDSILYPCNQFWIYDILFINNFAEKKCLAQTWYTSVDMQIYVLVPLIFFPLMYYEKVGSIWLAFMTLVSFVIPTVITHIFHFGIGFFLPVEEQRDFSFFLYNGPWSRMSPYLIGLWTGYIIYKTRNKKVTMAMWQVILGWVTSVVIGLLVVYGPHQYNKLNYASVPTEAIADVYNGFFRGAWGLALMWVVLACHYGYGGLVNSFLAHPTWQPLSRLTYGMFLVSITIQTLIVGSQYTTTSFDHLTIIRYTCGTLFISGIGACILSLLTEGPVLGLEKLLFGRQEKKENIMPINVEEEKKIHESLKVEATAEKKLNSEQKI